MLLNSLEKCLKMIVLDLKLKDSFQNELYEKTDNSYNYYPQARYLRHYPVFRPRGFPWNIEYSQTGLNKSLDIDHLDQTKKRSVNFKNKGVVIKGDFPSNSL